MTKYQLMQLLFNNQYQSVTIKNVTGCLQSIEREDGSGRSFNVTLATAYDGNVTVYVRTID